jgi:pyruvate formate lyase activating enzyme
VNIKSESNFWNQKIVYDITKFTTTDYAGHLSCIIWFIGCNLRCLYCYNDDIVYSKNGKYDLKEVLLFLKSRVGLLDSVVLSGGEASIHNLIPLCKTIKRLGFKIKLDTNGSNLRQIRELINLKLIDYIAIDFKATKDKFKKIVGIGIYDNFIKTIKFLIKIDFNFELRTTVNTNLIDEEDINNIILTISKLGYKNIYYLQNFLETSSNIGNISDGKKINKQLIDSKDLVIQYRN